MWRHSSTTNHRICLHGNRSCDWLLMADVTLNRILVAWSRKSVQLVGFNWLIIYIDYAQPLKLRRLANPTQTPKPLQIPKPLQPPKSLKPVVVEWRSVQTLPCLGLGFDAALPLFRIGVRYNISPVPEEVQSFLFSGIAFAQSICYSGIAILPLSRISVWCNPSAYLLCWIDKTNKRIDYTNTFINDTKYV